jgi:hypothetical protein
VKEDMANYQYNDVEKIFSPGVLIPEPKFIPTLFRTLTGFVLSHDLIYIL